MNISQYYANINDEHLKSTAIEFDLLPHTFYIVCYVGNYGDSDGKGNDMSSLQKINATATQIFALLILASIFTFDSVDIANSANRLALVIGNSNYQHTSPLRNPANDADLIGGKLSDIGFDVLTSKDTSLSATRQVISEFAGKIRDIGDDAIVLFYYAGHGIQYNGKNFIVPVDANLQSDTDIILQGVDTSFILKIIELSGAKTNIVVLDACRNNPFPAVSRSVAKGLARMDSPSGSFIAYSTAPGAVALDGNGKNSPYTMALAEYITDPDLTLEAVFKKVRRKVYYDTDKAQTTWESTSLIDEIYLVERSDNAAKNVKIKTPNSAQNVQEENFWNQIRDKDDAELFQTYLQMFPDGKHREIALAQLPRVEDATKKIKPLIQKFDYTDEQLEAKFSKFDSILSLLTDDSTHRAITSYDRYLSWCCKNQKNGPTGKERYIVYGLYQIYPLNWDQYKVWAKLDAKTVALMEKHNSDSQVYWPQKFADLPLQLPAFDTLDNATAGLINAFIELHPINNKAAKYYTNNLYEFDNAKGARKLHKTLMPAFEKFIQAYQNLSQLVLDELDNIKGPQLDYIALKHGRSWKWYGVREHYYLAKFIIPFLQSPNLNRKILQDAYSEYVANFLETSDFSSDAPPPPANFSGLVSETSERVKTMKKIIKSKDKRDWSVHLDVAGWY
jgi:uncharacterized caspase-like protein